MRRVTGLGGVFFKAADPAALSAWYQEHLGLRVDPERQDFAYGRFAWIWDPEGNRIELWGPPKTEAKAQS